MAAADSAAAATSTGAGTGGQHSLHAGSSTGSGHAAAAAASSSSSSGGHRSSRSGTGASSSIRRSRRSRNRDRQPPDLQDPQQERLFLLFTAVHQLGLINHPGSSSSATQPSISLLQLLAPPPHRVDAATWREQADFIYRLYNAVLRCSGTYLITYAVQHTKDAFGLDTSLRSQVPVFYISLAEGLGSRTQQQCFGLCCWLLKAEGGPVANSNAYVFGQLAMSVANMHLGWGLPSPGASGAAEGVIPWLVLLGRCCLFAGMHITQLLAALDCAEAARVASGYASPAHTALTTVSAQSAQLAALGYSLDGLLQKLQDLQGATGLLEAFSALPGQAPTGDSVSAAALGSNAQQLGDVGTALSNFATPLACNYPYCVNMSGTSELKLVGGHSTKCSGCRTARYCSKSCQLQHWQQHRPICKALAAAATAGAGAGAASTAAAEAAVSARSQAHLV